ncbi:MAG: hypothetical protein EZS26_002674 [Candidatus Ordinivivax streblomastigis]|uniref:F5/8 type C domain-containing protein n=1 Tax=Candidatus Ordinivivax streblomastigis TaxID=2540710 RepID=A0A5M8NWR5_9BACT|nr:MAG: hypothetical protein EZS26_002674 [Candidatus Ordinivivax streblomastigis]
MKTNFLMGAMYILMGCCLSGCVSSEQESAKEVIFVNRVSLDLFFGDTEQLIASPTEATFDWSSEDETVAKVSATGLVEAVGVGSTRIVVVHDDARTFIPMTVTIPLLDNVIAMGGYKRILLNITAGERIKSVKISYTGSSQPTIVTVDQPGVFPYVIDGLEENTYTFTFVAIDRYGNESEPTGMKVKVYGDDYQASILNRNIQSAIIVNGLLTIKWADKMDNGVSCNIFYTNTNEKEVVLNVPMTDNTTVIDDWKSGLRYNTLFVPDEFAIDTFYTSYTGQTVLSKINKTNWAVTANSFEPTGQLPKGGVPEKSIDDDATTFWHSQHTGSGSPGYPYWLAYDMQVIVPVGMVELTSRSDFLNNGAVTFILQGSDDDETWVDHGTFTQRVIVGPQPYTPIGQLAARYIRIYMTDGPGRPHSHLAEFSVYGIVE